MHVKLSPLARTYAICGFLGLGGFMYGYDSGTLSGCLVLNEFQDSYLLNKATSSILLSVPLAASCVASIASGSIGDKIGRKWFLFSASGIHLIGTITQAASTTFAGFLMGKLIAGISIGMLSVMCPLYQSEVSLPERRGRLISMHQFGVTVGFCLAFWITYATFELNQNLAWRIPITLQILPPLLFIIGLYFIPESPRWLTYQGRYAESKTILKQLRDSKSDALNMELIGMIQDCHYDHKYTKRQNYASLLDKGIDNNRKRTILGVGLHVMTQLTGINALMFYFPYILESTGLAETNSVLLGNGISGMVNMLATIPLLFYVDKWGRRTILFTGGLAMASCMVIIAAVQGAFYSEKQNGSTVRLFPGSEFPILVFMNDSRASFIVLVFLCLFLACFALSWGSMGWIYPAEIYPQTIRTKGLGVTTGASFATSIFVSQIAPILFRDIGWGTWLFFGGSCFIQAWIVQVYYPETKGRSLEEIHLIFSGALIDQSPGAHHPQTAFEALSHLQSRVDLTRCCHGNNNGSSIFTITGDTL